MSLFHHVKRQLIILEIHETKLPDLPNDFFQGFEQLDSLYIYGCNLKAFPNLNGVDYTITMINLAENGIANLDNLYGTYLPELRDLELAHNFISVFTFETASKWPELRTLDLSFNQINRIFVPASITTILIAITDNPLVCDEMSWLRYCKCLNMTNGISGMIRCGSKVDIFTENSCCDIIDRNTTPNGAGRN